MLRSTIMFLAAGLITVAWAEPAQAQGYRGRGWGGGNYYAPYYGSYYHGNYGWQGTYYPRYYGYGFVAPRYYSYSYPSYGYSYPNYSNYHVPNDYSGGVAYNATPQTSTSFYGNPNILGDQVRVRVILPDPSARLWVENQINQATGTERIIVSPSLDPNMNYTYTMKATWIENGQEVTREKKIDVKPGQEFVVNFNEKV